MEETKAKAKKDTAAENLSIYERAREVPTYALKEIKAGRLKGMSDINPMFRIKRLTELFGPCGFGWKYDITKQWLEIYGNEVKAFTNINLYVKVDGEWSEAIPGTGGSAFVAQEKGGAYVNDEAYKMSLTDAISVATKALGVAADIYYAKDGKALNPGDSKYQPLTQSPTVVQQAIAECNVATSMDGLMLIWNKYGSLHQDNDFLLAMSTKKKEFQK